MKIGGVMTNQEMNQTDWWQKIFDQKYLDTYLSDLTPERTLREVDFVVRAANLQPSDRILDLACGHGRHSIELAKRGFNVAGLDYSEPFIEKAKTDAKQAGVNVEFIRGDMKNLPFNESFDVVLMLFTAFGYFSDEDNQKTLGEISKSLKPSGRFLIDVISGEAVINRFNKEGQKEQDSNRLRIPRTYEVGGLKVDEVEWFDPDEHQIHNHREWVDENGQKKEYDYYLRVYTVPQYKEMLSKAGLQFREVWGDFQGSPHNQDNFRTIMLAEKAK